MAQWLTCLLHSTTHLKSWHDNTHLSVHPVMVGSRWTGPRGSLASQIPISVSSRFKERPCLSTPKSGEWWRRTPDISTLTSDLYTYIDVLCTCAHTHNHTHRHTHRKLKKGEVELENWQFRKENFRLTAVLRHYLIFIVGTERFSRWIFKKLWSNHKCPNATENSVYPSNKSNSLYSY